MRFVVAIMKVTAARLNALPRCHHPACRSPIRSVQNRASRCSTAATFGAWIRSMNLIAVRCCPFTRPRVSPRTFEAADQRHGGKVGVLEHVFERNDPSMTCSCASTTPPCAWNDEMVWPRTA